MPPTMVRVRPRKTSAIALPAGGAPLPEPGRRVPLSPFDAYWVTLPPVRRVFLYRSPPSLLPFTDVVAALRSSLERVLPAFHPFAGVLTSSPDSQELSIVLPDGEGACSVALIEAETDLEFDRLVEEYDEEALRQLAPDIRRDELPAPVMAAQVTEFVGGVAVGVAVHHSAADGRGLWRFLEMWSAAAAGVMEGQVWPVLVGPEPLHDRRLVRFDGDDDLARLFLRQLAPDFPRVAPKQDAARERERCLSRRTFTFAASAVQRLKQRLAGAVNTCMPPSTFAAMAAHGWVSIARARGFTDNALVFAVFLADCRAHMSPPVPGAYVGNCLALCTASLSGWQLAGPDGPPMALLAIQEAVAEVKRDPLGDRVRWCTKFAAIPPGRAVILAGSPWFPAYGVDFGLGRPARVELASMNHDGEMVLVAGRERGSVQASVAIAADKMTVFRGMFELECDRASAMPVSESE
ncbi:anthocyanin 5-aromatic acyltransferase [Lolium perenne]|uniref:anthocyanin 5-aromatic acyltransferase n=1 Tax=Lolium perenne TaxID=4522 RepID=UPI0021F5B3FD|nr:anthocyanin 5-aromatic acyltransferase-like [Lolium perenne]